MIEDSEEKKEWNGKYNKNGDKRGEMITHGLSNTRIYSIWVDMKKRCNNPKNSHFKWYGAKGIKLCDEWENDFVKFYNWAIQNGYDDSLSIERIDINKGYSPQNCKWIPFSEQQRNTNRSHFVTCEGITKTITEWSEITGLSPDLIKDRINKLKWTDSDAVSVPVGARKGVYGNKR